MSSAADFAFAPALEQAAAVKRGELSSAELVEVYLERIEELNPRLNAYRLVTQDLARQQARQPGEEPLAGVPTSVKDLVGLKDHAFTYGSRAFEDNVGQVDYFMVARLKEEGCPILGKTTTPEFGSRPTTEHGLHGTARNPWNPEHNSGGSSGGAGVAVAAGLCAFAHATDGGGSVRIPASWCGCVGLKPSRGRISVGPLLSEGWAGLSTSGVIARTVADAAAGLDAMAGHLPGDPYWADVEGSYREAARPSSKPLRVAFTSAGTDVDPAIVRTIAETARLLESLGHQVSEGGPDTSGLDDACTVLFETALTTYGIRDRSILDPINQAGLEAADRLTAADYLAAVNHVRSRARQIVAFWEGVDVLVTPTMPETAPRNGAIPPEDGRRTGEWIAHAITFTRPYNVTGQPAISLPLAMHSNGLPIGVQLVGPPRGERAILGLAAQLEEARPWHDRRPPLEMLHARA